MSTTDKKITRTRLDSFLAERGISASLEKAKSEILSGWVKVNGETVRDTLKKVTGTENIEVERPGGLYVSRGGDKLARALDLFGIKLEGLTVLDLGASTGGFTDCMLKHGALKVYALDVGYNQIDYSLRVDPRVVVMEKTHAKDIVPSMFHGSVDFFTADLSFISILKVLPAIYETFSSIDGVILIKPQFEAEPLQHRKGVVEDPGCHKEILCRVLAGVEQSGFHIKGLTWSPIKGPAGNIEFLAHISRKTGDNEGIDVPADIDTVVNEAHRVLDR